MTATVSASPSLSARGPSAFRQTYALSKRSTLEILRQPALVAPSMIFPLFFAALGTSSFGRAVGTLPGLTNVDSFLEFSLASTLVQGVLFGSTTGGAALATDISNGFMSRLLASPSTRTGILVGRLAGGAVFGAMQSAFFILVLLPFGVRIESGVVGALVMILTGALVALSIGGFMTAMALKTGSAEAVQGSFPLLFISLFFSSAFFPRESMQGVYQKIANVNPLSYLVEGVRSLTLDELSARALAQALLIPVAIGIVSISLSLRQLSKRLAQR